MNDNTSEKDKRREAILEIARKAGHNVTMTWPGELIEDVDGSPIAMTENRAADGTLTGVTITADEARELGIDPNTPGVHFAPLTKES